ncbi:MAG: hypothetical protein IPP94_08165 [Ignavibacteria bacterium]|nr:hypothetical protein [Ignavibacteria bacterium]
MDTMHAFLSISNETRLLMLLGLTCAASLGMVIYGGISVLRSQSTAASPTPDDDPSNIDFDFVVD